MTDQPPAHDLSMPHDMRYNDDQDTRGCPPNCPRRRWTVERAQQDYLAALDQADAAGGVRGWMRQRVLDLLAAHGNNDVGKLADRILDLFYGPVSVTAPVVRDLRAPQPDGADLIRRLRKLADTAPVAADDIALTVSDWLHDAGIEDL